jgi:hypothetical protein
MDITYCNDTCTVGQAARDDFLASNNSAYDAAMDFRFFVKNCFLTCPHKNEHNQTIEGVPL